MAGLCLGRKEHAQLHVAFEHTLQTLARLLGIPALMRTSGVLRKARAHIQGMATGPKVHMPTSGSASGHEAKPALLYLVHFYFVCCFSLFSRG